MGKQILKDITQLVKKNFIPFSVVIICMYGLYLRLMALYERTLWADEIYQLSLMKGSFLDLLINLPACDHGSYLEGDHFLIYPFFKLFSYNKWGLAIPHIIATIIGFYLLYLICKRYFKSIWAYLITFGIVCFNATLIYHSIEIRPYAVLPTLALATFYLFQKIADSGFKLTLPKRIGFTAFFVLVIWFHVYGILMFVSSFIFIILVRYLDNHSDFKLYFRKSIGFTAAILIITFPLLLYCVFGPRVPVPKDFNGTFVYIPNPAYNIVGFLKGIICNLIGNKKLYFLFLGIIVPFILSYKDRYKQLLFLFSNVIFPVVILLLVDIVTHYWFLQRQFIWVMPFFAFFLGWAWDSFFLLLERRKSAKSAR